MHGMDPQNVIKRIAFLGAGKTTLITHQAYPLAKAGLSLKSQAHTLGHASSLSVPGLSWTAPEASLGHTKPCP